MRVTLTYNTETKQVKMQGAVREGLSPLFLDYVDAITDLYQAKMQGMEAQGRVPVGKLELELTVKQKTK